MVAQSNPVGARTPLYDRVNTTALTFDRAAFESGTALIPVYLGAAEPLYVPRSLITAGGDAFHLDLDLSAIDRSTFSSEVSDGRLVIPVIVETAQVTKRRVVRGRVRLHKTVQMETVTVDEPGYVERVEVRRVEVNQPVESAPGIRYEGDTMIIPVVQEVIVVEKRLIVREEIYVTKQQVATRQPTQIDLRRESVSVERFDAEGTRVADDGSSSS